MKIPKSVWEGVSCDTDRQREAAKSWFNGMADDMVGPTRANTLTRVVDDKPLKLRALFTDKDGKQKELVRTFGRNFTITITPPTSQPWA